MRSVIYLSALTFLISCAMTVPAKITIKYDRFNDYSTKRLWPVNVVISKDIFGAPKDVLQFSFNFISPGNKFIKPDKIRMRIKKWSTFTEGWQYLKSHRLVFIIDGQRVNIGELEHDGDVGHGFVTEYMYADLTTDLFYQMANAKSIEGQLFATEFKFSEENIQALKDFAEVIPK